MRSSVVLPAPLRPDQGQTRARLDVEADVAQRREVAVELPDTFDRDRGGHETHCHGYTRLHTDKAMLLSACIRVHPWLIFLGALLR